MAAPAGLAVLVGQLLNTFGAVQTYEHVLTDGSGTYKPAALLRPGILGSRENPKICGIDDAEVVGDLVAVDMPVPRHLLAQKS
jgi:hypothetical protein